MTSINVPFGNLRAHYQAFKTEIDAAVARTLASGWYILGNEVREFEKEFAEYVGVRHCVTVGNGTDAIEIALRGLDIGVGAEVITASHTATFTALGITGAGATPVFADIDEASYTLDVRSAKASITPRTRAIMPVHLYGVPAELDALAEAVGPELPIIEDVAQAHGAELRGRRVGSIGHISCFSFYPSKNLGALGDGGAVTTNNDELAERCRQLRNGGQKDRYSHVLLGVNTRLDEIQAAILRATLPHLPAMNERRRQIAARYQAGLRGLPNVKLPLEAGADRRFVYHLYVIRCQDRDGVRAELSKRGIDTQVHYPIAAHRQPAFDKGKHNAVLPATDRITPEILSLPMYPTLTDVEVDAVIAAVREVISARN